MARLPIPGQDDGTWGDVLNTFLQQSHNTDGTLKPNSISNTQLASNSITTANLQDGSVTAPKLSAAAPDPGQLLSYDGTGLAWATGSGSGVVPDATTTGKGLVQLAGDLAGTAASPTVPGLASKEPTVASGTTSQYYRGDKSWQTLDKIAVGLTNVDNTSDVSKPVSTATQTALNTKATDSAVVHNTGTETVAGVKTFSSSPVVPTPTTSTQAANKGYVDTVAASGAADATTATKGLVQLAGDLAGTAGAPTIATGAVTSAKIADGTIVDGDISATAAIAQSKVSGLTTALNGKAASGANSDITSLSGLTTALSVGQGGTGSTTKNFVDLSAAQTVAGVKTFSSSPVVPTPTTGTQAANKTYVDTVVASGAPDATTGTKGLVQLAGDLAGTAAAPTVPGLAAKAADSAVVHNTGTETVAGVKTFSASPIVPTPTTNTQAANKSYVDTAVAAGGGGGGSGRFNIAAVTANYTAADYDFVIGNAVSAGFTVTLPAPIAGGWVRVKKVDSTTNAIIVMRSSVLIDDQVSISINSQWQSQDFASDGTKWYRI
jgi:hypothetical protein